MKRRHFIASLVALFVPCKKQPPTFRINLNTMSEMEFALIEKMMGTGDLEFGKMQVWHDFSFPDSLDDFKA